MSQRLFKCQCCVLRRFSIVFKTAIKQRPFLFCCILISFFFAIIQVSTVQAATQQAQTPQIEGSPTPIPTPTPASTPTPTHTAAPPVTVTVSSSTVPPGSQITITGENWLPAQQLTVQIALSGQSNILAQDTPYSDTRGHFSTTLTIPTTATTGAYAVIVVNNDQSLRFYRDNMLMVTALTPTPTPSPSATPTPSSSPSATATETPTASNANGGGGSSSGLAILTFITGGLGILLIIIGVIMFAASSPPVPTR
jgi:hypothetical protein